MALTGRVRLAWLLPLLAGVLLRTVFVFEHPRWVGDTLIYADLAHNLLRHGIYGVSEQTVRPTLIRLPGYPLFLAGCFAIFGEGRMLPVVWLQVLIDLWGCLLLAGTARRVFGPRCAQVTLWLAALCPFSANYTAAVLTETWSLFSVSLALWGLVRWQDRTTAGRRQWPPALATGAALAWAALLRPDGVLLAAAVLPAMAWFGWRRSRESRPANTSVGFACAALLPVLCLGAWSARNWRVFHVVQPLAPKYANDPGEPAPLGFARWYRTWAIDFGSTNRVYWSYDGSPLQMSDLPARAFDGANQRLRTERLLRRYNDVSAATPAIDQAFDRLARERIREHPLRYFVGLPLAKLADMWLRPRTELMRVPLDWWRFDLRPWTTVFQAAYGLLNLCLLALGGLGLWRWRRAGWRGHEAVALAMVGYVVLRCGLLLVIDNSEPRYTLECYPIVLLLASRGLVRPQQMEAGS